MNELLSHWVGIAETRGVRILVIALLAFILARILKAVTSRLVQASKGPTRVAQLREQQTRTMAGLLYSLGVWIIVAVAILTALPELGFDVTPVAATAAVASLAFGFGAQTLVKDLINGFFIVFEDQYVVGDFIQLNGETGRVEYLTLRRTVLRNASGAIVTIPNSLVGQVANLNRDWSQAFIDVTVPSAEEIGRALAALEENRERFPERCQLVSGAAGRAARAGRGIDVARRHGAAVAGAHGAQPQGRRVARASPANQAGLRGLANSAREHASS